MAFYCREAAVGLSTSCARLKFFITLANNGSPEAIRGVKLFVSVTPSQIGVDDRPWLRGHRLA
jgi:hypothetical protein